MCSLLSQGFQLVRLLGFFLTTLCWDVIECFLTPAPAPSGFLTSRCARRTKLKSPFIRAYPRHWLMLMGFLACDSHHLVHPFTLTGQAIQDTWIRTLQLDSMVDLSSDVLLLFMIFMKVWFRHSRRRRSVMLTIRLMWKHHLLLTQKIMIPLLIPLLMIQMRVWSQS